ncbi:MAG: hypothetical protein QM664_08030 [Flavihumibacter sp.]
MRAITVSLLAIGMSQIAPAQKVNLDHFSFTTAYRSLPALPVDTSFHSYDFHLQAGPLMGLANRPGTEESLYIEGWIQVMEKGDLTVSLWMEDLLVVKSDVDVREELKRDKAGKVINRSNYFAPLLTYTYAARMEVRDKFGNQLQARQLVTRSQQFQYKGAEFGSRVAAQNILLNQLQLTTEISGQVLNRTIRELSNSLTAGYGYAERRVSDNIWVLNSPKHPENDAFRTHWGNIRSALFRLQPDEPVDNIRESVAADITYFEQLPLRYTCKDKASRKLRYASYYLLAKVYYYFDDPYATALAANQLVLNNYDTRDGFSLENAARQLIESFRMNKRNSRHFTLHYEALALGLKKY